MEKRCGPLAVGIVGPRGVGKTTLLDELVCGLALRGLSVGIVTHPPEEQEPDDSAVELGRSSPGGPRDLVLAPRGLLLPPATPEDRETRLTRDLVLRWLSPELDVVLVEGLSWEAIPRIVIVRAGSSPDAGLLTHGEVIWIVRVPSHPRTDESFWSRVTNCLVSELAARLPQCRSSTHAPCARYPVASATHGDPLTPE